MRLVILPAARAEVSEIKRYYTCSGGQALAEDFYRELHWLFHAAAERPESFSIRQHGLRRANLHRFPYHFLFRITENEVLILVVRHNRRHPYSGIELQ